MASIPKPFTLSIQGGDTINYKGTEYVITNVAAGVDNGEGVISYSVTLTGGAVITCSANDTILSSSNNGGVSTWAQTAEA